MRHAERAADEPKGVSPEATVRFPSGLTHIGGICRHGFPGLLYFLHFAGVALVIGSLNPCLCYFAPHGAWEFGEPAVRG